MRIIEFDKWSDFLRWLEPYRYLTASRREMFLWRGQSDAGTGLVSTLDRQFSFKTTEERESFVARCLIEFKRDSYTLGLAADLPEDIALELLARHHGLPSALLDFTISPYIAAYFAFAGRNKTDDGRVVVWRIDRALLDVDDQLIGVVDDLELLRFNPRALRQRGIFIRVNRPQTDLATILGDAVAKIVLPASEARQALLDLEAMTINAAYLFDTLDGAAQSAFHRVALYGVTDEQ
jgi:hypothetical protein